MVFTTHRETVSKFSDQINICSILAADGKTFALPYIDPDVMMQLTGVPASPLKFMLKMNCQKILSVVFFLVSVPLSMYMSRGLESPQMHSGWWLVRFCLNKMYRQLFASLTVMSFWVMTKGKAR